MVISFCAKAQLVNIKPLRIGSNCAINAGGVLISISSSFKGNKKLTVCNTVLVMQQN
jgi:hypothetical protein